MKDALLIVGAGYTGSRLASLAAEDGQHVVLLARNPTPQAGCQAVSADLDNADSIDAALRALDSRNLAWRIAWLAPPPKLDDGDIVPPDQRLKRLLSMLPFQPVRIVLASTSGVYGDHGGRAVCELTPPTPRTTRARARLGAEQTLLDWAETRVSHVILRIAGIYGPGRLPLQALRDQQPIIDPAELGPGNRIHVDDLARAFLSALLHEKPPALINVCDGDHASSSQFTLSVADVAGLAPPPYISLAQAQEVFSPMRLSFINESRLLDNSRLVHELGVSLAYANHRDGIRAALADKR